jgi:hypothetical protein
VRKEGERRACWLRALFGIAIIATGEAFARQASAGDSTTSFAPAGHDLSKTPVHIERSSCRTVPITEVLGVLRVELAAQLVEWPLPDKVYQVTIDCSEDDVSISVTVTQRETRSYRTNLSNAPSNLRPRIVALAIAEIVRDLDRESAQLALAAPMPKETAGPPQAQAEPRSEPTLPRESETRAARFGVFAEVSTFGLDGRWLAGAGPRFDYVYRWLCAGFDAALIEEDHRFSGGSAQVLLGYGSPYIGWRGVAGRLQARLGVGYALGAATVVGQAAAPGYFAATQTGPWAAPYAFGAMALALTNTIEIDVRAHAGWVTMSVVGEVPHATDVNLSGLWTGVQIGTAFTL